MKLCSNDPSKTMRLSTSFNVRKEKVHNWRDYLRLHCYPLEKYIPEWPSNPSSFNASAGFGEKLRLGLERN
ncbi:Flavanone 3-dioxygenase [Bertholletia excelsa]